MVLPLILAIILTVIYGYAVADPWHYHWFALVVTIDAYLFIMLSASTAGTTYVIDSHPKRAGAMLVVLPVTRGLVGFGISYHTADYIKNIGAVATFGIYAGVSALVGVLGLVLFWKGKPLRHFCANHVVSVCSDHPDRTSEHLGWAKLAQPGTAGDFDMMNYHGTNVTQYAASSLYGSAPGAQIVNMCIDYSDKESGEFVPEEKLVILALSIILACQETEDYN
ncbi:hypothetical protein NM208_g3248 [Fusarium decemcellulare]|uniref:Uncharacterized protein n=1 Tax=Fusarium decemcellulare TaxID=57161 RepID=A0ACC1SPU7_9HYPO|nr:hypothetical protein NM208_g3248 [Fusarium decemcellulare]